MNQSSPHPLILVALYHETKITQYTEAARLADPRTAQAFREQVVEHQRYADICRGFAPVPASVKPITAPRPFRQP